MANNNIPQLAEQVVAYLAKNPQLLGQFVEHPYSTVQTATGSSQQLGRVDMSQLLTAAASLASGQTQNASSFNQNNLASLASNLLGQNDNSIHSLASSLFGAKPAPQVQSNANSGLNLGSIVSMAALAGGLLGATKKKKKPGLDLSDGLGMDDLINVAGDFLGGNTTAQTNSSGLDLGSIANIASMFLGK